MKKNMDLMKQKNKKLFFHKGKKNQWKKKLNLFQIKKIENELKEEMKTLGYIE